MRRLALGLVIVTGVAVLVGPARGLLLVLRVGIERKVRWGAVWASRVERVACGLGRKEGEGEHGGRPFRLRDARLGYGDFGQTVGEYVRVWETRSAGSVNRQ